MCKKSKMKVRKISGFCKDMVLPSFKPGSDISVFNHCWNAILIQGEWYFLDVTFGSGGIKPRSEVIQDYFNPFYFLTPAEYLAYSHKPLEDYWEFTVITDGHLINELNGKDILLGPHSLFITSPRDFHRLKKPAQYKDEKLRYFNIIVRENKLFKILNSISHNLVDWFYKNTTFEPFPETLELMIDSTLHRINLIEKNNPVLYNDMICSALLIIIQYVYGQSINQIYVDDPWANELYKKMQSVDFVKLNVEGLCDEMGYSRTQMNRLMKQHFNQTPHEFIMDKN